MSLVSLWIRNPRLGPGRGTSQAGAWSERRPHIEMMSGSHKRDAVRDSSAVPSPARLDVEFSGAGQAITKVFGSSAKGAVDRCWSGLGLRLCYSWIFFFFQICWYWFSMEQKLASFTLSSGLHFRKAFTSRVAGHSPPQSPWTGS